MFYFLLEFANEWECWVFLRSGCWVRYFIFKLWCWWTSPFYSILSTLVKFQGHSMLERWNSKFLKLWISIQFECRSGLLRIRLYGSLDVALPQQPFQGDYNCLAVLPWQQKKISFAGSCSLEMFETEGYLNKLHWPLGSTQSSLVTVAWTIC